MTCTRFHEELDVTWGFHEGTGVWTSRVNEIYGEPRFYRHVASHLIEMQQALIAVIVGGVFEFFPKLRMGFLEAQNSWAPGILTRIEWDYPQYRDLPCALPLVDADGNTSSATAGRPAKGPSPRSQRPRA